MKRNKLLIAGGIAAVGGILIYMGMKASAAQPASATTPVTKPTNLTLTQTWDRDTGEPTVIPDRLKNIVANKAVSGLGNAYLLN